MFEKGKLGRFGLLAVVLLGLVALAMGSSEVDAGAGCSKAKGRFTLEPVTGPACLSPVGICAAGAYTGDMAGTSFFTASSVIATVDTPTTSVVLVTGDNVFQTDGGQLTTKDAITLKTTGAGEFAEVDTVVAGSGEWSGATGVIQATGTFSAAAGGDGRYEGELCVP